MRKLFLTLIFLGLATPSYASTNPVGDFFGGLFGYHGATEVHSGHVKYVTRNGRRTRIVVYNHGSEGGMVADIIGAVASIDPVMGGVDR